MIPRLTAISSKRIIIFFFVLFFSLCLLHHFSRRPLWNDEQYIVNNFKELTYTQMFGPLRYSQAFPRAHMALIRFISGKSNYDILLVRLFSLVSMGLAFFVWAKVYKKVFKDNFPLILALLSFSASYSLSYYASELKPYATDVLVAGLFVLFLFRQEELQEKLPSRRDYFVVTLLPITLLFSYASLFIVWIVGLNFLLLLRRNKKILPLFLNYALISCLSLGIAYHIDIKFSKQVQEAYNYWNSYFVCRSSVGCFFESFFEGMQRLSTWWFGNTKAFKAAASPFIAIVLYSLVRYGYRTWGRKRFFVSDIEVIASVLFLELFVFGLLRKYPFTGERITLFFAPFVFALIIRGIMDMKRIKIIFWGFSSYYVGYLLVSYTNSFLHYLKLYQKS